jgi:NAD(P)H-flavin reductase
MATNPMRPSLGRLVGIRDLATGIKLFQIELVEQDGRATLTAYKPGQFAFISAFGAGEAPFGIASIRGPYLEFAINALGHVTNTLHSLEVGDPVGVRGPLGRPFPLEELRGKNIIIIGGGIGGAPLRPVIQTVLDNRGEYGHLTILWAARSPDLLVFTDEFDEWRAAPDTGFHVTVDREYPGWSGNVGLITQLLERVSPSTENAVAITCGPPIMIHFVFLTLAKMGFKPEQVLTTLEARMHCGIGKCGRCNLGEKFICIDGPVFWQSEIAEFVERSL